MEKSMNVWKIASRWSDDGNSNSVLNLFKKYRIAFVYEDNIRTNEVSIGDLLAISDGKKIVGIGKVLTEATPVNEFKVPEIIDFNEDECTVGFKVELIDLGEKDIIYYDHMGRFHELHNDVRKRVLNLWDQRNKRFSINAKTCTLKYNNQNNGETIFDKDIKYIIPIYQRPYSWTNEQIIKFVSEIFQSYWGNDGHIIEEPMFIGTMQLSEKKFSPIKSYEQDIIDGQQRLTTFLVLLRILQLKYINCKELMSIEFDWLETRVSNGQQELYLTEFLNSELEPNPETLNNYLKNAYLITEIINEQLKDEQGKEIEFDIERFAKHVLSNIYFVVIETYAGLSKTLQIFNAINTTGLDLNTGDIFKIRMYEYLHDKKKYSETAFNEISAIYERIDNLNDKAKYTISDIRGILNIYQFILISKYGLPNVLYSYATDTFYERLFDSIFNINQWEHFRNIKDLELSLLEINKIIDVRYTWENQNYMTAEDACMSNLVDWSRYGRYNILIFVFLYRFKDEDKLFEMTFAFIRQLSKLFIIYSIRFQKAINEIHSFIYSLSKAMINGSYDGIMQMINIKIGKLENHKGRYDLENVLDGDLTYSYKVKNIVCRLSAMLDENYSTMDPEEINIIENKLFYSAIDIEHIQAYHDIDEAEREKIWKEWGSEINSLGNLVVLEQFINRSIRNLPYSDKRNGYKQSCFCSVKNIINNYNDWTLQNCITRKKSKKENILNYIFSQ